MTSNRPTSSQRFLKFACEAEQPREVPEPQRGQSVSAAMKKTTLSPVSETLMEQIVDLRNMERAWKNVKANRGAPGPDGVTLDEFFQTFRNQWPAVRQQLLEGTYEPEPARRKSIPQCLLFWGAMRREMWPRDVGSRGDGDLICCVCARKPLSGRMGSSGDGFTGRFPKENRSDNADKRFRSASPR